MQMKHKVAVESCRDKPMANLAPVDGVFEFGECFIVVFDAVRTVHLSASFQGVAGAVVTEKLQTREVRLSPAVMLPFH